MRTILFTFALAFAAPALACPMADAAAFAEAAEKVKAATGTKATLVVDGMHCGSCSEKVTAALTGLEGVTAAATDYQTGKTVVAYDAKKVDTAKLIAAIKTAGFQAKAES